MNGVLDWVLSLAGSPWTFVAVTVVLALGGTITVLPTQALVVAVTTLLVGIGDVPLGPVLLFIAATIGMVLGDMLTYVLARVVRIDRLPLLRGPRLAGLRATGQERLLAAPAPFMITSRFIPMGRIVTNVAAAESRMLPVVFVRLATVAAALWALFSIAIGSVAGVWAARFPVAMVLVAVGVSLALGLLFQYLDARWRARHSAVAVGRGTQP